jgi:acetolactate synthase-1/2/3 large subunit
MNGAESLVRTLLACGVDTCFANPGTSEMHFVAALDRVAGMHCILGLFEGVVTGAADGYARMAGKPAATLLHCGPGLANGLANLHNARRAPSPVVNLVGDQATHHRPLDAVLTTDTESLARSVSSHVRTARYAHEVGAEGAAAVRAARAAPGHVATLILPSDSCWSDGGIIADPLPDAASGRASDATIAEIAKLLASGEPAVLLLGGAALTGSTLDIAGRIAARTGARLMTPTFPARMERGQGRVPVGRIPYPVDLALAALAGTRHLLLVGATEPVAFFAYPGKPGRLRPPDSIVHVLARPDQDVAEALARLATAVGAEGQPRRVEAPPGEPARGPVTAAAFGRSLAAILPDDAVVIDEGLTFGAGLYAATASAAPHDWLQLTGGAIGDGLPLATGAAVGAPGRRVVTLQADGSALYTVQALWTQAREELDVTTIIFANRKYAILEQELAQVGAHPGRTALDLFDLGRPTIDWVRVASGFGVEAARAETMDQFNDLFVAAEARSGPFLIELLIG